MKIVPIKTHTVTKKDTDILSLVDRYIDSIEENSILVVTSKIVSICEGRIQKIDPATEKEDKEKLVKEESEYFIDKSENQYGFYLTITHNLLIPTAGIDESNGNGYFILWPKDPQETANKIRKHISQRHGIHNFGVIITDSKSTPLRMGTSGVALAHSGFSALNDYVGKPDLFGRELHFTKSHVADGIAAGAVVAMGEGQESTPFAMITDMPNVTFQQRNPTTEELEGMHISVDADVYAPILKKAPWQKGKRNP